MNFVTLALIVIIFTILIFKFSCLPNLFMSDSYDSDRNEPLACNEANESSNSSDILPPYTPPSLSRTSKIDDNLPPSYEITVNCDNRDTIEIPPPSYTDSCHKEHIEDIIRE